MIENPELPPTSRNTITMSIEKTPWTAKSWTVSQTIQSCRPTSVYTSASKGHAGSVSRGPRSSVRPLQSTWWATTIGHMKANATYHG
jgi:hypothetical protein